MGIKNTSAQDTVVKRPKKRVGLILFVLILVVGGTKLGFTLNSIRSHDTTVNLNDIELAEVVVSDLSRDIMVQAKVIAANSPTLYAPSPGVVTFNVKAGDQVNRGQLLLTIDSPRLQNELKQGRSELSRLEVTVERHKIQSKKQRSLNQQRIDILSVNLKAAQREMNRAKISVASQLISEIDFEEIKDQLAKAELELRQAKESAQLEIESLEFELKTHALNVQTQKLGVEELERKVEALKILSPVAGMVGRLSVQQKQAVDKNAPLLTVVDLTSFELEAKVPENYADDLGLAMPVEFKLDSKKISGEIAAISPEIVDQYVTARIRFTDDGFTNIRQSQRLSARILLEQRQKVLTLPRGPYLKSGDGYVWKVENDRAIRTQLSVGASGVRQIEILQGLNEGDRIIVSSTDELRGAQKVLLSRW